LRDPVFRGPVFFFFNGTPVRAGTIPRLGVRSTPIPAPRTEQDEHVDVSGAIICKYTYEARMVLVYTIIFFTGFKYIKQVPIIIHTHTLYAYN
jgi:hypothetical protein